MFPLAGVRAANVALSDTPATAIPRQFGPDQPAAVRPHQLEEAVLPRSTLAPDLREPGRDDHERLDACLEGLLDRFEHGARRQRDDRDVDLVGNLGNRAVRPHTRDGLSVSVHGVRSARKVSGEDVPEQLAADRASSPGGADHGHAPWLEERAERRGHGGVVALLDSLAIPLGRSDRELHLELAALELARQLEADRLEDAEHVAVLRHHLRDEALDPDPRRTVGQPLEETRPDSAPLVGIGDREGGLRDRRIAKPHVARDGDDLLAVRPCSARPAACHARSSPARAEAPRAAARAKGSRGSGDIGSARRASRRTREARPRLPARAVAA